MARVPLVPSLDKEWIREKSLVFGTDTRYVNCLRQEKKRLIVELLVDGMGMRAICRVAKVATPTLCNFVLALGAGCLHYLDHELCALKIAQVHCDEMWSFVQSKRCPAWTWVAIDPASKLFVTWRIGDRSLRTGQAFMDDLRSRIIGDVAITTDAHNVYGEATEQHHGVDHHIALAGGYKRLPGRRLGVATTYAVERHNLTMRTSVSRYARGTNGFSKSPLHLNAHLAIYALHYNFARVHQSHRVTPAMEAGIEDRVWTIDDMLTLHPWDTSGVGVAFRQMEWVPQDVLSQRMDVLVTRRKELKPYHARDHKGDSQTRISRDWIALVDRKAHIA